MQKMSNKKAILLLLISLLFYYPTNAFAASAKDSYTSAKSCMKSLYSSSKKRKWRANWGKCIKKFKKITKKHSKTIYADDSLFFIGKLYDNLYKYSSKKSDLKKSKKYYSQLIKKYPRSAMTPKAKRELSAMGNKIKKKSKKKARKKRKTNRKNRHITSVRHWSHPDFTRIVIDTSGRTRYKSYSLQNPDRIFIEISNADITAKDKKISIGDGIVKGVYLNYGKNGQVKARLNLNKPASYKVMPFSNPDRIVIDVSHKVIRGQTNIQGNDGSKKIRLAQQLGITIKKIVIDPGHGGKDPGAIGKNGLKEKDVVLDISKRVTKLIKERLNIQVIMTRKTDKYVPLEKRTVIANANKADLFVSVHINASAKRKANGLEVYLLGQSSDRKAMRTAARENSTSEMAMSDLENILNDLLIANKVNESLEFAHLTKSSMASGLSRYKIKDNGVKRAPFYVLMNAKMPSILVEASFVSNKREEKLLKKPEYRQAIAEAIFKGIGKYIASLKILE